MAAKGVSNMYYWIMRYICVFGTDFPVSAVKDKSEYEILQIIRECCESEKPYTVTAEAKETEEIK
jgi:hypothetical protein